MKISTTFDSHPIPTRNCDWSAIDADTYDGTEDDPRRHQIGHGATEDEAVTDLIERLLEDEPAEIVRRVREFDGLAKALKAMLSPWDGFSDDEIRRREALGRLDHNMRPLGLHSAVEILSARALLASVALAKAVTP